MYINVLKEVVECSLPLMQYLGYNLFIPNIWPFHQNQYHLPGHSPKINISYQGTHVQTTNA